MVLLLCFGGFGYHGGYWGGPAGSLMKLGRLPHDPVAVASAPQHRFGAVRPPRVLDRANVAVAPEMYDNDNYTDCTAVALANSARAVAALNGFGLVVDPAMPLVFFAKCIGNPPDLLAAQGAVMLDVLTFQQAHGFDIGPQTLAGLFGTVALTRSALALSMARLGPSYWGVTLLDRDMQTFDSAGPWDVQDGRDDGSVEGGHAIFGFDYTGLGDDDTVRVGSWGVWKPATWAWIEARIEEAYGVVWRQLMRADGTFYSGLSVDGLVSEL